MNDIVVSIRMPSSLVIKLKEIAEKEHYLDISEIIRSIVRKRWLADTNPELVEISKLRNEIASNLRKKCEREITEKVIEELNQIKKTIIERKNNEI